MNQSGKIEKFFKSFCTKGCNLKLKPLNNPKYNVFYKEDFVDICFQKGDVVTISQHYICYNKNYYHLCEDNRNEYFRREKETHIQAMRLKNQNLCNLFLERIPYENVISVTCDDYEHFTVVYKHYYSIPWDKTFISQTENKLK